MTAAYICDKCGLIIPVGIHGEIHEIWFRNPIAFATDAKPDIHLCGACFGKLKREYMENLEEEGGCA